MFLGKIPYAADFATCRIARVAQQTDHQMISGGSTIPYLCSQPNMWFTPIQFSGF
jgi:hypothetical protein